MNTVIFDLDGTLLPMDFDKFLKIYMHEISKKLSDLIEPEKTVQCIWKGTEMMIKNDGRETNETVFFRCFKDLVGEHYEEMQRRFDDFYRNEYKKARAATSQDQDMINAVHLLGEKGYALVVATNPLFPEYATHQRLEWAGFSTDEFEYITNFEKNCSCKPNPLFFREVLKNIDKRADECLMVGNDVHEDLIASEVGIRTFLITNHMLNKYNKEIVADYIGNYEAFYHFVQSLPVIGNTDR